MRKKSNTLCSTDASGEICTCGHTRAQHEQGFAACLEPCLCTRFTWDASNPQNAVIMQQRAAQRRAVMS